MNETINKIGLIFTMLFIFVIGFVVGYWVNEIIDDIAYKTAKQDYETNCAILSKRLVDKLQADGYNASYVKGWVAHDWVICYNCTPYYDVWYDYDGSIIKDTFNYKFRTEKYGTFK